PLRLEALLDRLHTIAGLLAVDVGLRLKLGEVIRLAQHHHLQFRDAHGRPVAWRHGEIPELIELLDALKEIRSQHIIALALGDPLPLVDVHQTWIAVGCALALKVKDHWTGPSAAGVAGVSPRRKACNASSALRPLSPVPRELSSDCTVAIRVFRSMKLCAISSGACCASCSCSTL